jgi:hypothetical protein
VRGPRGLGRSGRIAGILILAVLLPGCLDLPDETKGLVSVFIVVLSVNVVLNLVLVLLILFYFLPFTRPKRTKRRR